MAKRSTILSFSKAFAVMGTFMPPSLWLAGILHTHYALPLEILSLCLIFRYEYLAYKFKTTPQEEQGMDEFIND